ncbi:Polyketide synthase, phosphopantetheine-binding domain [Fusarium oxysporum f. sp. vasinfectum]|nr:Polyketide synthase, phosphopantetheine-binding domain [Fusarium oxysporum f. sp. vasinfectum]
MAPTASCACLRTADQSMPDLEPAMFPQFDLAEVTRSEYLGYASQIDHVASDDLSDTCTALWATWAILLGCFTGMDNVCFGFDSQHNVTETSGPAERMRQAVHVRLPANQRVEEILTGRFSSLVMVRDDKAKTLFNTILSIQSLGHEPSNDVGDFPSWCKIRMTIDPVTLDSVLTWNPSFMSRDQAENVSSTFDKIFREIINRPETLVSKINWSIEEAITQLRANWALLTPTFVKFINPANVPTLKTLVTGGEAMTQAVIRSWSHINLINCYGPAETASIKHGIVVLPREGFCNGRLLAIVQLCDTLNQDLVPNGQPYKLIDGELESTMQEKIAETKDLLSKRLPSYMIPSMWLAVEFIPRLQSGKLDRKQTAKWVDGMSEALYRQLNPVAVVQRSGDLKCENKIELELHRIWTYVLNLKEEQLGLAQSFLSVGGDSISAMQVMSECKKRGLGLAVSHIINCKSISALALQVKDIERPALLHEMVETPFDLSPIQKLYFSRPNYDQGHYNQSFLLRTSQRIHELDLRKAMETLISRHSMLRAKFQQDVSGEWEQRITNDVTSSYRLRALKLASQEDVDHSLVDSQTCLDPVHGPLVAADLIDRGAEEQLLFVVAHHLVIDLVSWRIILQELEEILLRPEAVHDTDRPLPFQVWCNMQSEHAHAQTPDQVLPIHGIPEGDAEYWGMTNVPNIYGQMARQGFEIGPCQTSLLVSKCHDALRTEIPDVLMAAMVYSFGQIFTDRPIPAVFAEGHGREVWDSSIDLSNVVGWFTTIYPVFAGSDSQSSLIDTVKMIKDARRKVPDNGRPYFASRWLTNEGREAFSRHWPLEITFNYLGQYQQLEREGALFTPESNIAGEIREASQGADVGPLTACISLFEVSAVIVKGSLRFSFGFNQNMKHQPQIRQWISCCEQSLGEVITSLASMAPEPTLSDFPLLSLTYDRLRVFTEEKLPEAGITDAYFIQDAYPCSPMQSGLLVSTTRENAAYAAYTFHEVKSKSGETVDVVKLITAWKRMVQYHTILRTIFLESVTLEDSIYDQVVLKEVQVPFTVSESGTDDEALAALKVPTNHGDNASRLLHHFHVCTAKSGKVFCRLDISHVIMDGTSLSILFRDLALAYQGSLKAETGPPYRDYIKALQTQPVQPGIDYWKSYLAGIEPCLFPVLDDGDIAEVKELRHLRVRFDELAELQSLCERQGVTIVNAIYAAWAVTLHLYTGSDEVCFGYLTSARDLPIEGIRDTVGPIINMVTCRVNVDSTTNLGDIMGSVQRDYLDSLEYRHTPLAQVHHALQLSDAALFNTALSYRKLPPNPQTDLVFEECCPTYDPDEYSVSINVEAGDRDMAIDLMYWSDTLSDGQASNGRKLLACFICADADISLRETSDESMVLDMDQTFRSLAKELEIVLFNAVPAYMVPSAWLPVSKMPLTSSGKLNRRSLRVLGESVPAANIKLYKLALNSGRAPFSEVERQLAAMWAQLLNVDVASIGVQDHFFKLGGDSIGAMQLVTLARRSNIDLTVAGVFQKPSLLDMAESAVPLSKAPTTTYRPFSLLSGEYSVNALRQTVADSARIEVGDVQDIYPCSALQEGLMALSTKEPGAYVAQLIYRLPADIDTIRFQKAWNIVVEAEPTLRTRIVHTEDAGFVQVVVAEEIPQWSAFASLSDADTIRCQLPLHNGGRLTNYGLVKRCYHDDLSSTQLKGPDYSNFIKYLTDLDPNQDTDFWKSYLSNMSAQHFPRLPNADYQSSATSLMTVAELLASVQDRSAAVRRHQFAGIQSIRNISADTALACGAQNLLAINYGHRESTDAFWCEQSNEMAGTNFYSSYPLMLSCHFADGELETVVHFDQNVIPEPQMQRIMDHFALMLESVSSSELLDEKLGDIHLLSSNHYQTLQKLNRTPPPSFEGLIHDAIRAQTLAQAQDKLAVVSWDQNITYADLDSQSTRLAGVLVENGVSVHSIVPFCMDKSSLVVVSILAILKSGAAFVPLDPAHPDARIKGILADTGATVVLSSDQHAERLMKLGSHVISVSQTLVDAQLLQPSHVPGLETLVLGGEAMSSVHISSWASSVRLMNAYGPSETAVVAAVNPSVTLDSSPSNIGRAFHGRKDDQVKVNGQRIELSEIEHHLSADPAVESCLAAVPASGPFKARLVAILSPNSLAVIRGETTGDEELQVVHKYAPSLLVGIREGLARHLTSYMIPSLWIVVNHLPLLPSGKLDRRRAVRWVEDMTLKQYHLVLDAQEEASALDREPSEVETKLRAAWAKALNLKVDMVPFKKSFIHLGGDSISAMKLMAICRSSNMAVTVSQIMRAKSIIDLASTVTNVEDVTYDEEQLEKPFELSPIQKVYFESIGMGSHHFNQSMTLATTRNITSQELSNTLHCIVKMHSMMRARFSQVDGNWTQRITSDIAGSYTLRSHGIVDEKRLLELVMESQTTLNIVDGPIFAADMFEMEGTGNQIVTFVAHHLIVDVVSWNIILQDLEGLLSASLHSPAKPFSFQAWSSKQHEEARKASLEGSFHDIPVPLQDHGYWGMEGVPNLHGDSITETMTIPTGTSTLLSGSSHDVVDVLLASLLASFRQTFPDRSSIPPIFNEGHGREPPDDSLDLSRTVGWFTTLCPVFLPEVIPAEHDILDVVCWIRDFRRKLPGNGRPYFAHSMLPDSKSQIKFPVEIAFNFLGHIQDFGTEDSVFRSVDGNMLNSLSSLSDIGANIPRLALIEISASFTNERLTFDFSFNRHMHNQLSISRWTQSCRDYIHRAAQRLSQVTREPSPDLSLLPLAFKKESQVKQSLDEVGITLDNVEAVYPCSSVQQGILLSQIKDPGYYSYSITFLVTSIRPGDVIDVKRLSDAWKRVVHRHSTLRTAFMDSLLQEGAISQVVLRNHDINVSIIECPATELDQRLSEHSSLGLPTNHPPHRLTIFNTAGDTVLCILEMSHSISDGTSMPILFRDLGLAYEGSLDTANLAVYRDYVSFLQRSGGSQDAKYWKEYLDGAEPCCLPLLTDGATGPRTLRTLAQGISHAAELQALCTERGITLSNLLQLAWALVLQAYTGLDDVCFGYLVADRDVPVSGIDEAIGVFITMLVCRVRLDPFASLGIVLQAIQEHLATAMNYKNISLASFQHAVGISNEPLFNTAYSFQRRSVSKDMAAGAISFDVRDAQDPSEYDMTVNVEVWDSNVELQLCYWQDKVSDAQAANIASTFDQVLSSMARCDTAIPVGQLNILSDHGRQQLMSWNNAEPELLNECPGSLPTLKVLVTGGEAMSRDHITKWAGHAALINAYGPSETSVIAATSTKVDHDGSILNSDPATIDPFSLLSDVEDPSLLLHEVAGRCGVQESQILDVYPCSSLQEGLVASSLQQPGAYVATYVFELPLDISIDRFKLAWQNTVDRVDILRTRIVNTLSLKSYQAVLAPHEIEWENHDDLESATTKAGWVPKHNGGALARYSIVSSPGDGPCHFVWVIHHALYDAWSMPSLLKLVSQFYHGDTAHEPVVEYANFIKYLADVDAEASDDFWRARFQEASSNDLLNPIQDEVGQQSFFTYPLVVECSIEAHELVLTIHHDNKVISSWQTQRIAQQFETLVEQLTDLSLRQPTRKVSELRLYGQEDVEMIRGWNSRVLETSEESIPDLFWQSVLVNLPQSGIFKGRLVAITSLQDPLPAESSLATSGFVPIHDSAMDAARTQICALQHDLVETLPPYMVPSVWLAVRAIPLLLSGKLDRASASSWLVDADVDFCKITVDLDHGQDAVDAVMTPASQQLRRIWASVLNIPETETPLNRSLISLGGDSIMAIQILTRCHDQSIALTMQDIMSAKGISELATVVTAKDHQVLDYYEEDDGQAFELSPIQRLFFNNSANTDRGDRLNQSQLLSISRPVDISSLQNGLDAIVERHPMLRARFNKSPDAKWTQHIASHIQGSYGFKNHEVASEPDMIPIVAASQSSIDVSGPVFAVDLFTLSDGSQVLSLVAHHLVVDIISWINIIHDLEALLTSTYSPPSKPLSFRRWNALQIKHVNSLDNGATLLPFVIQPADLDFWGISETANVYGDMKQKSFVITETDVVSSILGDSHRAFKTEPLDLFITAILKSFAQSFVERELPTLFNEGHGREPWDQTIDPSQTVGWFTSLCPVHVSRQSLDHGDDIDHVRRVKDVRRSVPSNGRPYFAHRYLTESGNDEPMEILLNYLGRTQQSGHGNSLFSTLDFPFTEQDTLAISDVAPETCRLALFEISISVLDEGIVFTLMYNQHMLRQDGIEKWVSNCKEILINTTRKLAETPSAPTLSDFPLLPISYTDLHEIITTHLPNAHVRFDMVEDMYPCSPIQTGILLSQLLDPSQYLFHVVLEVTLPDRSLIDTAKLLQACHKVIERHPALRTIFIDSLRQGGSFDQVVLRPFESRISAIKCREIDVMAELNCRSLGETNKRHDGPVLPYQITICETPQGKVFMKLELNHAVTDGASTSVLLQDISNAYTNSLPPTRAPSYKEYIKYISNQSTASSLDFWKGYLSGSQHTAFPTINPDLTAHRRLKSVAVHFDRFPELQSLGSKLGVTFSNIVMVAWALLLGAYTDRHDVCFGYLASGRDARIDGVESIVGPLINMLVFRFQFTPETLLKTLFHSARHDYMASLPHQHFSLSRVSHALGQAKRGFFNTAVSIQNAGVSSVSEPNSLTYEAVEAYDPSEYAVTLNANATRGDEGIVFRYWTNIISSSQAQDLAVNMSELLNDFIDHSESALAHLRLLQSSPVARSTYTHSPEVDGSTSEHDDANNQPKTHSSGISASSTLIDVGDAASMSSNMCNSFSRDRKHLHNKLSALWRDSLEYEGCAISPTDNFFESGGDSIIAMSMNPEFGSLLDCLNDKSYKDSDRASSYDHVDISTSKKENCNTSEQLYKPLCMLDTDDAEQFVRSHICPVVGVSRASIIDVLPTTDFQDQAIHGSLLKPRWQLNYFHLDSSGALDISLLRESITNVVAAYDILRTVFVHHQGRYLQVILRQVQPTLIVEDVDSIDKFTSELGLAHQHAVQHPQEPSLRFIASFEGDPIHPTPSYASYIQRVLGTNKQGCYAYWRALLKDSTPTNVVQRKHTSLQTSPTQVLRKVVSTPSLASVNITTSTVIKAAWASALARVTGKTDVVFGNIISGRNSSNVPGIESLVGPCLNVVPVRVRHKPSWTVLDLLQYIQNQQVDNMPYETLGFREIINKCTDWDDDGANGFSTVVQHQSMPRTESFTMGGNTYQVGVMASQEDCADLSVVTTPQDVNSTEVCLVYNGDGTISKDFAEQMFDFLCDSISVFSKDPYALL